MQNVKMNSESAFYIKFAQTLQVSIEYAKKLYSEHGKGKIYINEVQKISKRKNKKSFSTSVFVINDTPSARFNAIKLFGFCVIVDRKNEIVLRTPFNKGQMNREKNKAKAEREKAEREKAEREKAERAKAEQNTRYIFEICKGRSFERKGGKGNALSDIGKYNNRQKARFSRYEQSTHQTNTFRYNNHLL